MKNRLLITIFISLSILSSTLAVFFAYYLSNEKIKLLDNQLIEISSILEKSSFINISENNFYENEEIINKVLGQNRIGKLFTLLNNRNEIIFKSKAARLGNINLPTFPMNLTYHANYRVYRILNKKLEDGKILQTALILDTEDFNFIFIFKRLILYSLIVSIPIFLISYFITLFLFKPIVNLANYLKNVGLELELKGEIPLQPKYFEKYKTKKNQDEFSLLINEVDSFIEKLKLYNKVSKPWSYRLAHELQTPMSYAILEINELENSTPNAISQIYILKKHLKKVSELITNFLAWSTSENSFSNTELYINDLKHCTEEIVNDFNKYNQDRINLEVKNNFKIICNQNHLVTVITNLISNALKYTNENVEIIIDSYTLTVIDYGEGLPNEVMQNLGQPFNFSGINKTKKGNGLGLAWIETISKHYYWNSIYQKNNSQFIVVIDFSKNKFGLEI